jgi:dihydrofolate synthase/folylpolyglutamate synthase
MDGLTDFEQETLIALEYFRQHEVDIAILEVGLGGRLDATNVIAAENRVATAITNISFDHMDYLGDTLEKIRYEKEGIRREAVPHFERLVVNGERSTVNGVVNPNSVNGDNFLLALEIFESINNLKVTEELKDRVLEQFPSRYKGRFNYSDGVLIDGAHNPDGMRVLNSFIQSLEQEFDRKIFVLAFLDKDYQSCLRELFANDVLNIDKDIVILTELDSDRATPAALVEEYIEANCLIIQDPHEAISKARELKTKNNLVVITGSLKLIACT